jgi:hypothetical protein
MDSGKFVLSQGFVVILEAVYGSESGGTIEWTAAHSFRPGDSLSYLPGTANPPLSARQILAIRRHICYTTSH